MATPILPRSKHSSAPLRQVVCTCHFIAHYLLYHLMYRNDLAKYYVKTFILYKVIASIFQALHLVKR